MPHNSSSCYISGLRRGRVKYVFIYCMMALVICAYDFLDFCLQTINQKGAVFQVLGRKMSE